MRRPQLRTLSATLAVLGALVGCGGASSPKSSTGETAPTSADTAVTNIKASLDGRELQFGSVAAFGLSNSVVELVLAHDADCLRVGGCADGSPTIKLRVADTIGARGARSWRVVSAVVGNSSSFEDVPLELRGDPAGRIALTVPRLTVGEHQLTIDGPLELTVQRGEQAPAGTPQPKDAFAIEGVNIPIHTVLLKRGAEGDTLVVSSSPVDCYGSSDGALAHEANFWIAVPRAGEPDVRLEGELVQRPPATFSSQPKLSFKVGAEANGVAPVSIELDFAREGLDARLKGTLTASLCPNE
ncbi:MAG: hypothetical protein U0271_27785 [Polyangiaceae bacterium]